MNVRVIPVIIGIAPMLLFLALTLYRVQLRSVGWALAHAERVQALAAGWLFTRLHG